MSVSVLNTTASLGGKTLAKLEDSQTFTGQKTFDLGASAPFIVVSGAAKVTNLDADMVDGEDAADFHDAAQLTGIVPAASLSLANLWSVLAVEQTYTFTGSQNNVAPSAGDLVYIRCTGAAPVITGFSGGVASRKLFLKCLGTTLKVSDQTGSSAANQIICPTTGGLIVGVNGLIELTYDATSTKWRASILDSGSPITFTPTWTGTGSNPVINSGTLTGKYSQRGKTVWFEIRLIADGTTTFGTGTYAWALPLTAAATQRGAFIGHIIDSGTTRYVLSGAAGTTATVEMYPDNVGGGAAVGQTVPMTWASGDSLTISGEYELP